MPTLARLSGTKWMKFVKQNNVRFFSPCIRCFWVYLTCANECAWLIGFRKLLSSIPYNAIYSVPFLIMNIQSGTILFDFVCVCDIMWRLAISREILHIELLCLELHFQSILVNLIHLFQFHLEYEILRFKREQRERWKIMTRKIAFRYWIIFCLGYFISITGSRNLMMSPMRERYSNRTWWMIDRNVLPSNEHSTIWTLRERFGVIVWFWIKSVDKLTMQSSKWSNTISRKWILMR